MINILVEMGKQTNKQLQLKDVNTTLIFKWIV